jgi:hypothetical protein
VSAFGEKFGGATISKSDARTLAQAEVKKNERGHSRNKRTLPSLKSR